MAYSNIKLEDILPYVTLTGKSKQQHIYLNSRGNRSISIVCPICGHSHGNDPCQLSEVIGGSYGLILHCYKEHTNEEYKAAITKIVKDISGGTSPKPPQAAPTQAAPKKYTSKDIIEDIVYTYHAADGTPVFYKNRIKHTDGSKDFPTYKILKNPEQQPLNHSELYKLKNSKVIEGGLPKDNKVNLYDLHILATTTNTEYLFIVEGEKCAEYVKAVGLTATTTRAGAGAVKLTPDEITAIKRFKNIILIPDNDPDGQKYYYDFKVLIPNLIKLDLELLRTGVRKKYDIADYLAENGLICQHSKPTQTPPEATQALKAAIIEAAQKAITAAPDVTTQGAETSAPDTQKQKQLAKIKNFIPLNFTYIEQARILTKVYSGYLRYDTATGWLYFTQTNNKNGAGFWDNSKNNILKAKQCYAALTEEQLKKWADIVECGYLEYYAAENLIDISNPAKYNTELVKLRRRILNLQNVSDKILNEAAAFMEINILRLDSNPFYINTPDGIIDLKTGKYIETKLARENKCTRQTAKSPSNTGMDMWVQFIDDITCGDKDLAEYMQLLAGETIIGEVVNEHLILAYNEKGRNGKSTYFNTLYRVLGTYAFTIPTKILFNSGKGLNAESYLAEVKGKRMLLLPEMKRGEQLEDDVLKKLTSKDSISACKKYHDPIEFAPSHTTIVFTNHLPKIQSDDGGTHRRLQVIPFNAEFPESTAKKNLADELFNNAGEAVIQWAIDGAKKLIAAEFKIKTPAAVDEATKEYVASNDTIQQFIDEECTTEGANLRTAAKQLYDKYLAWCDRQRRQKNNLSPFTRNEFKQRIEAKGYIYKRFKTGVYCQGLAVQSDFDNPFI